VSGTARAGVVVRRARQEDVPRLAAWNARLIRDERNDQAAPDHEIEPRLRAWLAKDYVACVFETDSTAFGYAIFRDLPDCVHLRHFFVEAPFRRRGLGRRAFELLREMFPRGKRVLVEVLVGNAAAAAFWRSMGFEERYLGLQLNPLE
jgi:ribosomal protein S18 acetylase RimI-like enzyme